MGGLQNEAEEVSVANQHANANRDEKIATQASELERVMSPDDLQKDAQNYDQVDAEVAKYANGRYTEGCSPSSLPPKVTDPLVHRFQPNVSRYQRKRTKGFVD